MQTQPERITRYLNNMTEDALRQAIRFIIESEGETQQENIKVINAQISEFNKMYPGGY